MDKEITKACFDQLDVVLANFEMPDSTVRALIKEYCTPRLFEKDEFLHQAGRIAKNVYFICSGLVRFYYVTAEGKEHNKSFSKQNQFAGGIQYSHNPQPSRFSVQAVESTVALEIKLDGLNALYKQSLPWANLGRLYMETLAVRKSSREAAFLLDSAEKRYQDFVQAEPELAARLPLYHIASYLGITDVALSRIRKRLKP